MPRLVNDQDVGYRSVGPCGETAHMMFEAVRERFDSGGNPVFATAVVIILFALGLTAIYVW